MIPVSYTPWTVSSTMVGRWAVIGLGAAYLIVTLKRVTMSPAHWMGLLFLSWCALGFLWSASPWDTAGELLRLALLAVVFAAASMVKDLDRFSSILALGVLFSIPFAVAQWFGYKPVTDFGPSVSGLFGNRDMLAEMACATAILILVQRRWVLGFILLALAFSTGSREPGVMLVAAALFLGRRRIILMTVLFVVPFVAFVLLDAHMIAQRMISVDLRLEMWQVAIANLRAAGFGLGMFPLVFPQYEFAHNEYVHYAFELGIGSVFLWGVMLYAIRPFDPSGDQMPERAALTSIAASCLVSFPLHMPATGFLFVALAGYLSGCRYRARGVQRAGGVLHGAVSTSAQPHAARSL